MQDIINAVIVYLLGLADQYPTVALILSVIGGVVLIATIIKPIVFWAVKKTATEKDDRFAERFYAVIEGTAFDFAPLIALFKRRNPKAAAALEKVEKVTKQ